MKAKGSRVERSRNKSGKRTNTNNSAVGSSKRGSKPPAKAPRKRAANSPTAKRSAPTGGDDRGGPAPAPVVIGPASQSEHSLFGSPSSLARTKACPSWISFGRDIPEPPETEFSKEGTCFHSYMAQAAPLYLGKRPMSAIESVLKDLPRTKYPDMEGWIMSTLGQVNDIWERFAIKHVNATYHFELKVKLTPDVWGTADVVFVGKNRKTGLNDVLVIDYKYGMGVVVSAAEPPNLQIIAYVLGAIATLEIKNPGVCMGIIAQMRIDNDWTDNRIVFHPRDFQLHLSEISRIVARAKAVYYDKEKVDLNAGEHCRFCKCAPVCPALQGDALKTAKPLIGLDLKLPAKERAKALEERVRKLTLQEQVAIFKRKGYIEDFLNAVASNLRAAFEAGVEHPDLKLVRTSGRRSWNLDDYTEADIASAMEDQGVKPWGKKPLKALTTLEKEGADVDDFVKRSAGNVELVKASDPRPSIAIACPGEI